MPKPKEQPKVRVYVYEHLLEMLRVNFPHLSVQTDSEILNYLMTKELSGTQQKSTDLVQQELTEDTVSFEDDVD